MKAVAILLALIFWAAPAGAVEPDEVLADPVLETRAREISKGLRCLVCQNQSIDDSNADLARDLRRLVRARLKAGDSDSEVVDYVVSRYGDFVLLKPPFKGATLVLWLGPAVIVALGLWVLIGQFRRRTAGPPIPQAVPLTEAERKRLDRLMDGGGDGDGEEA